MLEPAMPTASPKWSAPAAGFVVRNGPATQQDRWEEDAGYSPFTPRRDGVGTARGCQFPGAARLSATDDPILRETADWINDSIENWTYARSTTLAQRRRGGRLLRAHRPGRSGRRPRCRPTASRSIKNRPMERQPMAGGRYRQPGRAGAGAFRPAQRARPAHRRHGAGDRSPAQGRPAARACLAAL